MVVLMVLLLGTLSWSIARVTTLNGEIKRAETIQRELRAFAEGMLNAETGQRGFLLTRDEAYLQPYYSGVGAVQTAVQKLQVLDLRPLTRARVARMQTLAYAKLAELKTTILLVRGGDVAAAIEIVRAGQGKYLMDELRALRADARTYEQAWIDERREAVLSELNFLLWSRVAGVAAAILIVFLVTLRTARRLGPPIAALLDGIAAMAQGDLQRRVPVTSEDEIGHIASAFNEMADRAWAAQQAQTATQAELQRSNADLDAFAYVASHDLKAPLRAIRNLAQWIAEDIGTKASAETAENLRLLGKRVDRLDKLLESLLEYSRVGRKRGTVEKIPTGDLVAEIIEYLGVPPSFAIICAPPMPLVHSPKAPLEQVLRNLISNAVKHHDADQGQVLVSAQDLGEFIQFRIEDDGPGIDPEFHTRIFHMFQTLKPRDVKEGSGMGLAIVKKTVEGFGGQITAQAAASGRGVAFVFTWPKRYSALT